MTVVATKKILVLDAMGVIYDEGNDGQNLLYPFIVEHDGCRDVQKIIQTYNDASIGKISSNEFWRVMNLDPVLEDEYLQRHRLSEGLIEFLDSVSEKGMEVWCLSNDVSEWSLKLRKKFGLEQYIRGFVISGDVGSRKPDPAIYFSLLQESKRTANDVLFVDDRLQNIEVADSKGIQCVLFNPAPEESHNHKFPISRTFPELLVLMKEMSIPD
jgi:HAD superfamily hydrolase (TIGR01509 family)